MCNAHNHSLDCKCGWGGEGHKGRSGKQGNHHWPSRIPPIRPYVESFTIPNAKCPVCGDYVFYYCNEYGSSVYFDELGKPWSKHGCTDRGKPPVPINTNEKVTLVSQKLSEKPIVILLIENTLPFIYKLKYTDVISSKNESCYLVSLEDLRHLPANTIGGIVSCEGVLEISYLSKTLEIKHQEAFKYSYEANEYREKHAKKFNKPLPSRAVEEKKKQLARERCVRKNNNRR